MISSACLRRLKRMHEVVSIAMKQIN